MESVKALFLLLTSLLKLITSMISSLMILMTLTDLFAEIDYFDDIITDDSDDSDDEGCPLQVSDNLVRFSLFAQEARYGFSLQARPKTFRRRLRNEIFFEVKTWFNQSRVVVVCHWPCRESYSYRSREELPCNSTSSSSFNIVVRHVVVPF